MDRHSIYQNRNTWTTSCQTKILKGMRNTNVSFWQNHYHFRTPYYTRMHHKIWFNRVIKYRIIEGYRVFDKRILLLLLVPNCHKAKCNKTISVIDFICSIYTIYKCNILSFCRCSCVKNMATDPFLQLLLVVNTRCCWRSSNRCQKTTNSLHSGTNVTKMPFQLFTYCSLSQPFSRISTIR